MQTEFKNTLKDSHGNVPTFNLKIYVFIYNMLVDFLPTDILYDTITTNKFFINVHGMITAKIHLYPFSCTWGNVRLYSRFLRFKSQRK